MVFKKRAELRVCTLISAIGLLLLPSCAESGPATAADVCDSYRELAEEMNTANGLFDNGIFRKAKGLGNVAVRYEQDAGVVANGESLKEIGDSDETTGLALDRASGSISALCGQQSLSAYSGRILLGLD